VVLEGASAWRNTEADILFYLISNLFGERDRALKVVWAEFSASSLGVCNYAYAERHAKTHPTTHRVKNSAQVLFQQLKFVHRPFQTLTTKGVTATRVFKRV
jgi:hypothetical protein